MNKDNVGIIEVYRVYRDYAKQIFYITFSIFTISIIFVLLQPAICTKKPEWQLIEKAE